MFKNSLNFDMLHVYVDVIDIYIDYVDKFEFFRHNGMTEKTCILAGLPSLLISYFMEKITLN